MDAPGKNAIHLTQDPTTGEWIARIGVDAESGLEARGARPIDAVVNMALAMHAANWQCEPAHKPAEPAPI